ncbi:hypothetical protein CRM22_011296 [Opisthorchis felineus]|uniref:Tubby C-terminal domain-containing protein n=1 Tax=Opisthorchis felineus TaxID=147828 RepID=A0A4S2JU46_OPIFE|nr:hypothetical protein CRM22_011296 [Opisthorchis felineus]
MIEEYFSCGARHAKLEKQRELLRRKQKEKHAHQVLSLHATSENVEHLKRDLHSRGAQKNENNPRKHTENDAWAPFAYDGPQSFDLANPDELDQAEVQVIRVSNSLHDGDCHSRSSSDRPTPYTESELLSSSSSKKVNSPGITRSSTIISSLDQDTLLLSPSEEEEEGRDQSNFRSGDQPFNSVTVDGSVSPRHTSPYLPTTERSTPISHRERVEGRLIDWNADPATIFHEQEQVALVTTLAQPYGDSENLLPNPTTSANQTGSSLCKPTASPHPTPKRKTAKNRNEPPIVPKTTSSPVQTPVSNTRPTKPQSETSRLVDDLTTHPKANDERSPAEERLAETFLDSIDNLEEFVLQPAPKGITVRCRITRDKHGVDRGIFPTYYVHLERDDRKFFLLAARRRKRSATSNYVISCDATDLSRRADSFAGKLRSNFLGTQFVIYGDSAGIGCGVVGKRSKRPDLALGNRSRASLRSTESSFEFTDDSSWTGTTDDLRELAAIIYDTNVLGFKGPRKMTILIPQLDSNGQRRQFGGDPPSKSLIEVWKQHCTHNLLELHNKNPVWNEDTQSYVLNFYGRVTQASVKNFQIIHESDLNYIIMQFGRVAEDEFTMDYSYPMCALQAFGIALSSFDSKLACE